jgi:hypothetical protein
MYPSLYLIPWHALDDPFLYLIPFHALDGRVSLVLYIIPWLPCRHHVLIYVHYLVIMSGYVMWSCLYVIYDHMHILHIHHVACFYILYHDDVFVLALFTYFMHIVFRSGMWQLDHCDCRLESIGKTKLSKGIESFLLGHTSGRGEWMLRESLRPLRENLKSVT